MKNKKAQNMMEWSFLGVAISIVVIVVFANFNRISTTLSHLSTPSARQVNGGGGNAGGGGESGGTGTETAGSLGDIATALNENCYSGAGCTFSPPLLGLDNILPSSFEGEDSPYKAFAGNGTVTISGNTKTESYSYYNESSQTKVDLVYTMDLDDYGNPVFPATVSLVLNKVKSIENGGKVIIAEISGGQTIKTIENSSLVTSVSSATVEGLKAKADTTYVLTFNVLKSGEITSKITFEQQKHDV